MDKDVQSLLDKAPLPEAVWLLFHKALPDSFLNSCFDDHRERGYKRVLSFAQLVHLTSDALCQHDGSGRQSLLQHEDTLPVSEQAFYGKLRRLPVGLSEAFLADGALQMRPWLPQRPTQESRKTVCALAAF